MPLNMPKQRKRVKKRWFKVYADKTFNNAFLGEIYISSIENALNRPIFSNLSLLTGNYNHQYVNLVFVINKASADGIEARLKRYELQQSFIKRLIRKKRSKITDSFIVKFKDSYVTIKPLLITISKASKSIGTELRKAVRLEIARLAKEKNFEDFVVEVVEGKIIPNIKKKLSKIYPLSNFEFGVLETIPKDKVRIERLVKLEKSSIEKRTIEGTERKARNVKKEAPARNVKKETQNRKTKEIKKKSSKEPAEQKIKKRSER